MSKTDFLHRQLIFLFFIYINLHNIKNAIQLEWKIKFGPKNNNPRGPLYRLNNDSPTCAQYESILTYYTAIYV